MKYIEKDKAYSKHMARSLIFRSLLKCHLAALMRWQPTLSVLLCWLTHLPTLE